MSKQAEYSKEYREKNRRRLNEQRRIRYKLDADFRLKRQGWNRKYYEAHKGDIKKRTTERAVTSVKNLLGGDEQ